MTSALPLARWDALSMRSGLKVPWARKTSSGFRFISPITSLATWETTPFNIYSSSTTAWRRRSWHSTWTKIKIQYRLKKERNLYWLWQRCLRWFFVSPRGWWSCSKSCWCVCVASCPPQKWEVLLFHCRRCELRSPLQSDMKDKTIRVSFTWEQPGGRLHNRSTSQQPRHSGVAFSQTFQFDSKFGEGLLHTQTLPLPHEAVVDVNGYDLVLVQGFVQKSCTHGGVHAAAQQNLWERSQTEALRR